MVGFCQFAGPASFCFVIEAAGRMKLRQLCGKRTEWETSRVAGIVHGMFGRVKDAVATSLDAAKPTLGIRRIA